MKRGSDIGVRADIVALAVEGVAVHFVGGDGAVNDVLVMDIELEVPAPYDAAQAESESVSLPSPPLQPT